MIIDGIEHSVKPSFQPRYPQSPRISVGTWTCIELPGCNTAEKHRLQVCPPALDAKEAVPDRFTINPCGLSFQRVNPQSDSDATWTLKQHTLKSEHGMQVPAFRVWSLLLVWTLLPSTNTIIGGSVDQVWIG